MTKNERELVTLIRENENQGRALVTAVEIITAYLVQCESYRVPFADSLPEPS